MSTTTEKKDILGEMTAANGPLQNNFAELRKAGISGLEALKLPTNKTEEYRFTPIVRALEKAFPNGFKKESGDRSQESGDDQSIDRFLIPGLDAHVAVILDGVYSERLSRVNGIKVKPLSEYKGELLDGFTDPFAAMNAAWFKDGIFVDADKKISTPLLILNLSNGPVVHSRIVVRASANASVSIIEKTINIGNEPLFQTLTEDITVDENARVDYCKIQDTPNIIQVCTTTIRQSNSSHVNTFTLMLDGTLVRNNLSISIDGENCESHFHGLSLLKGDTIGDHHTVVDHRKPNSFSNELYKGVMDERSKAVFNGKIYVRPHAQKTNAFQSNRNILLTEHATINTKPQLEIWADDVKCSHGCTTGQLDDEALFYLQSRGIDKEDARAMLLYAFAMQTTELIALAPLKAHIDSLISKRLYA